MQRDEIVRHVAHVAYVPMLARASLNANISWRQLNACMKRLVLNETPLLSPVVFLWRSCSIATAGANLM